MPRVAPGDVLVTRVAGPALSHILPRVAGVVAELGGSTSHLASLARERGIPMVLGVLDATRRIPDGAQVAVDGVAGIVRWLRLMRDQTAHASSSRQPVAEQRARAPARGGATSTVNRRFEPRSCPSAR